MSIQLKKIVYSGICIGIFLLLWQLMAWWYNSRWFPKPMEVFKSFIHLITCKQNYDHISITILRVLVATSVTMLLGCVIGIIPKYSIQANYFINTVIYPTFQSIPPMVWVLLFCYLVWSSASISHYSLKLSCLTLCNYSNFTRV
jgi:ABC-type nitrate/sulfonate/bicarbonate transport system permease component